MISSKLEVIQFKGKPFDFQDLVDATGLSPASTRNILSSFLSEGLIKSDIKEGDRRKRQYKLNWRYLAEKLKNPDNDFQMIIDRLGLKRWESQHVALKDFQVIDADFSLSALIARIWEQIPSPDIVVIPVGTPKDVFTIEFQ
jgi:hypothetical protein